MCKVSQSSNPLKYPLFSLCVTGHPYEPLLAVSGIDHTIKCFSPDNRSQREARLGINLGVTSNQSTGFSRLSPSSRSRLALSRATAGRQPVRDANDSDSTMQLSPTGFDAPDEAERDDNDVIDELEGIRATGNGGLASRKRMHDSYQITTQNDLERQGGMRDAHITVRGPPLLWQRVAISFDDCFTLMDG